MSPVTRLSSPVMCTSDAIRLGRCACSMAAAMAASDSVIGAMSVMGCLPGFSPSLAQPRRKGRGYAATSIVRVLQRDYAATMTADYASLVETFAVPHRAKDAFWRLIGAGRAALPAARAGL